MNKKIKLVSWKDSNDKLPVIVNIESLSEHKAEDSAKELARYLMDSVPGSVLDILISSMVGEIQSILSYGDGPELLQSSTYVQERLKQAIYKIWKVE